MRISGRYLWLTVGLTVGALLAGLIAGKQAPVRADNTDHCGEYILCTGAISADFKKTVRVLPAQKIRHVEREAIPIDGIWLLDYGAGKLLATIVDRLSGKVTGFAELDLIPEFDLASGQTVHFTMTTGAVATGQSALYLTETNTGKMGIYTLNPSDSGVVIQRQELTTFRK